MIDNNYEFINPTDCDMINLAQNSDVRVKCVLGNVSKVANKIEATNTATAKGFDPIESLGGPWIIVGIVAVLIILVGGGAVSKGGQIKLILFGIAGLVFLGVIGFMIYKFISSSNEDDDKT